MKSRRSFLQFLALAPVAISASHRVVETLSTATAVPTTTADMYMTPARVSALINAPSQSQRQIRLLSEGMQIRWKGKNESNATKMLEDYVRKTVTLAT